MRLLAICILVVFPALVMADDTSEKLPNPGIGLLVSAAEMPALRQKITSGVPEAIHDFMMSEAIVRMNKSGSLPPVPANKTLDINSKPLDSNYYENSMPLYAWAYLITGKEKYAKAAWEIMENLLAYDVWPSYNGAPHIHCSGATRSVAITYDWIWDYLKPEQRKYVSERLIKLGIEPVIRTSTDGFRKLSGGLITNQINNMLSATILAVLAVRSDYPEAEGLIRGFTETLASNMTNSMGPQTEYLQNDIHGYWAISIEALVLSADALARSGDADLFKHPYLVDVSRYIQAHLATTPPMRSIPSKPGQGNVAGYDDSYEGPCSLEHQPLSVPRRLYPSLCLLGLAKGQHDQAAFDTWYGCYEYTVRPKLRSMRQLTAFHEAATGPLLSLLWYPVDMKPRTFTEAVEGQMDFIGNGLASIRTGFKRGDTHLLFGGNVGLSAYGEILGTGIGMVRFNPWTNYAGTENQVFTEDDTIAPNMMIKEKLTECDFRFIYTQTAPTDNRYYRKPGEVDAHKLYTQRDRAILFLRPLIPGDSGQFLFLDRVEQPQAKYHTWQWLALNKDYAAKWEFGGDISENEARLKRPAADMAIQFSEPAKLSFSTDPIPLMSSSSGYTWADYGLRLNARAGKDIMPSTSTSVTLAANGWSQVDIMPMVPPTKPTGKPVATTEIVDGAEPEQKAFLIHLTSGAPVFAHHEKVPVSQGEFYRIEFKTKKENGYSYWGPGGWFMVAEFQDNQGKRVGPLANPFMPMENVIQDRTYDFSNTDWTTLSRDMKVPAGATQMQFMIVARQYTNDGLNLWTGPITISQAPVPVHTKRQRFVTLLSPLHPNDTTPAFEAEQFGLDGSAGSITRAQTPSGLAVILSTDGQDVSSKSAAIAGKAELAVVRFAKEQMTEPVSLFAWRASTLKVGDSVELTASVPVSIVVSSNGNNCGLLRITETTDVTFKLGSVNISSKEMNPGDYRISRIDHEYFLTPLNPTPLIGLWTKAEAQKYAQGLSVYMQKQNILRDEWTVDGHKNLAFSATITASSCLDDHLFSPAHVADNEISEIPQDGVASTSWLACQKESVWRQTDESSKPDDNKPWIELDLGKPQSVQTVRIFNTTFQGQNDRATIDCQVQLLDDQRITIAELTGQFGKAYHGNQTSQASERIVPFGCDPLELSTNMPVKARYVRVNVLKWFGLGAGINEVQVYCDKKPSVK